MTRGESKRGIEKKKEREGKERDYGSTALNVSGCTVRRYKSQWHAMYSDCQRVPFDFKLFNERGSQDFYRLPKRVEKRASTRASVTLQRLS